MLKACRRQLRAGFGGAFALDYGAVFTMADALAADRRLLAEVLPGVEDAILAGLQNDKDGED